MFLRSELFVTDIRAAETAVVSVVALNAVRWRTPRYVNYNVWWVYAEGDATKRLRGCNVDIAGYSKMKLSQRVDGEWDGV